MRTLARFLSRGLILLAILITGPGPGPDRRGVADRHRHRSERRRVPGATVTATNQATNVDYTAVSNEAGNYT